MIAFANAAFRGFVRRCRRITRSLSRDSIAVTSLRRACEGFHVRFGPSLERENSRRPIVVRPKALKKIMLLMKTSMKMLEKR